MMPACCGKRMQVRFETQRFLELSCEQCNDVVYVKKAEILPVNTTGD